MNLDCKNCGVSFIGEKIPKIDGGGNYMRYIGIDGGSMSIYDGTVALECPDCRYQFPVSKHPFHLEIFKKYRDLKKKAQ